MRNDVDLFHVSYNIKYVPDVGRYSNHSQHFFYKRDSSSMLLLVLAFLTKILGQGKASVAQSRDLYNWEFKLGYTL